MITAHGLNAKKSLGQHFILDSNLTDRIAKNANVGGTTVIEVGAGPGGLTRSLLSHNVSRLIAIEKDKDCIAALKSIKHNYKDRLDIIQADALEIELSKLTTDPIHIVANLPYNISIPLLLHWLRQASQISSMTLMFQKEVADRLTAVPSTKAYGRMSVMAQWLCEIRHLFNVDKRAFLPVPKVMSSVISLSVRQEQLAPAGWDSLQKITASAFNQRRKMLRSSLKTYNLDFTALNISPELRAENLSIEQFCSLARAISR